QVQSVLTVDVSVEQEEQLVIKANSPNILIKKVESDYCFPPTIRTFLRQPVIVGMGPAGLFAALSLARAGVPSIILERGRNVDERSMDVEHFWKTGELSVSSNVQFGEGGAGTFSDGKLTTGTHDVRAKAVLKILVEHGAPEDIMYSHKPHVGTDLLREVVKNIRYELIELGCDVRFEHQLYELKLQGNQLAGVIVMTECGPYHLECDTLILAPGHSARDTFTMLHQLEIPMEQKPFAIGLRIEHKQVEINKAQFGEMSEKVPPSDYKLACHLPNGRSAFTFCVCPGGEVVAATSEYGRVVTNGMSHRARDSENINGGFLVGVGPADYPGDDPLAGIRFQEQWEKAAWELGGCNFHAPAQLVHDFLSKQPSTNGGTIIPTYRPGITWTDLSACLPDYVVETLRDALPIFDRKVKGFANPDSVLTGVETRSSAPLRILRDANTLESSVKGLYPCGEGAGYAGGIVSAAVDGMRVAEAIATRK
ncbi:MAG: hypothetical protein K0S60_712, partial [Evtepia sp.]|nr:hypothetical protein [Evtepia sp.]